MEAFRVKVGSRLPKYLHCIAFADGSTSVRWTELIHGAQCRYIANMCICAYVDYASSV